MLSAAQIRAGIATLPGFVDQYGLSGGLKRWTGIAYHRATTEITGRSIFEADWDVCILLDACRGDELERFRSTHGWLEDVDRFPSLASCTWNWLPRTVERTPDDALGETVYVSANPFAGELTDRRRWAQLDEVYRYAWDTERGTVYPRAVTDRAITHGRDGDPERLLVHYIQPHVPFLSEDAQSLSQSNFTHGTESESDAWDRVTRGDLARQDAIAQYRETLSRTLDEVDLLLSNLDADRVVVSADHGEAFGEWGIYGHPQQIDLPCLTAVPWVETTATDERTHTPTTYARDGAETTQQERLEALGYV